MQRMYNKEIIIVVGGFSSGRFIAPLFKGLGYSCIHVTSNEHKKNPNYNFFYEEKDYIDEYIISTDDEIKDFVLKMKPYKVKFVIAGFEPGVSLADKLSELFNTPRNIISLSSARRNKYIMHNILKKNGIKSAKQLLSDNLQDIINFYRSHGSRVVLKPVSSANTDSVFYCDSEDQIREAFEHILGSVNFIGELNTKVLVQEYLFGKQYIVNSISSNSNHYITDIWEEVRENDEQPSNDIYANLVIRGTDKFNELHDYTISVLNALGIKFGPAHSEIRVTEEGACLIETAARLPGNVNYSILHDINGLTQLSLLPDAMLFSDKFLEKIIYPNSINSFVRYVYLSSSVEGHINKEPNVDLFFSVDSAKSVSLRIVKGGFLHKTNRALRRPRPGYIYLTNQNIQKLEQDYLLIRDKEKELYESLL